MTKEQLYFLNIEIRLVPKSLDVIENNAGWTLIESDGSNLPKKSDVYWCMLNNKIIQLYYDSIDKTWEKEIYRNLRPTHYQEIKKPQKPVY